MYRQWKKNYGNRTIIRYYSKSMEGVYLTLAKGRVAVNGTSSELQCRLVESELIEHGINPDNTSHDELAALTGGGARQLTSRGGLTPIPEPIGGHAKNHYHATLQKQVKSIAKINVSTLKNTTILIDHREPDAILHALKEGGFNAFKTALPDGDFFVLDDASSPEMAQRAFLVERKTVSDLRQGIISEDKHCHDQAERYEDLRQAWAKEGRELKVFWFVESEKEGSLTLYNALDKTEQMDGWVSYLMSILNQPVVQTYSTNHTAYLLAKFTQGFVQQALPFPVKIGTRRVDKAKKDRINAKQSISFTTSSGERNAIRSDDGVRGMLINLPHINTRVAKVLADTGMSFKEIVSLDVSQLASFEGIGQVSAERIYHAFNNL